MPAPLRDTSGIDMVDSVRIMANGMGEPARVFKVDSPSHRILGSNDGCGREIASLSDALGFDPSHGDRAIAAALCTEGLTSAARAMLA
jgi:hypothetical protein